MRSDFSYNNSVENVEAPARPDDRICFARPNHRHERCKKIIFFPWSADHSQDLDLATIPG